MTLKKSTIKNILETMLEEHATETTKFELVNFKCRETEELGETLVYIDATEKMLQRIKKNYWAELKETVKYIYSVDRHEMMNRNFDVIWC